MGASSEAEPGDVVAEMIRERATAVIETEPAALAGEDDGVHQHRSQVRRLRDVLAAPHRTGRPRSPTSWTRMEALEDRLRDPLTRPFERRLIEDMLALGNAVVAVCDRLRRLEATCDQDGTA